MVTSKSSRAKKTSKLNQNTIHKVPEDDDTPIPFLDPLTNNYIECYADSIAIIDDVEYTIGNPCDTSVALCYFDLADSLIPIELDSPMMDEIFPMAASIVEDEFGEELVLERTPQTLTLVGELEEGGEDEDYDDEDEDDIDEEEEEVEILLSFDEERTEYVLVKLLDPVLLVGRASEDENDQKCILLTEEEADRTMPALEEMFLEFKDSSE